MKTLWFYCLLLGAFFSKPILAQKYWDERQIKSYVESMNEVELTDDAFDQLLTIIHHFKANPLAINHANMSELLTIPMVNNKQALAILNHRKTYGFFLHTAELGAVQSLSSNQAHWIAQFVSVEEGFNKNLSSNTPIQILSTHGFKQQSQTNYLGDAWQHRLKIMVQLKPGYKIGFQLEKDQGEPWLALKNNLFDYQSFHLEINRNGLLKKLVLGDYEMQTGQGLSLGMGYQLRMASDPIQTIKLFNVLNAHRSFDERNFIRGIAANFVWKNLSFTPFWGKRKLDGNIVEDSTNNLPIVMSESVSGYHRTASEIKNKFTLPQTFIGFHLSQQIHTFSIGLSSFRMNQHANKQMISNDPVSFYNKHLMNYSNIGLDVICHLDQTIFTAAYAFDSNLESAFYMAMMKSFGKELDWGIAYRHYSAFYSNPLAGGPFDLPTKNQTGFFQSFAFNPSKKWEFKTFLDLYYRNWISSTLPVLDEKCNIMFQALHKPSSKNQIGMQFRYSNRLAGNQLETFEVSLHQIGLHYHFELNSIMRIEAKYQQNLQYGQLKASSHLFYQLLALKIKKIQMDFQWSQFENSSKKTLPIFVHEQDLSGQSGLQVYNGTGFAVSFVLKCKLNKHLQIACKTATAKMLTNANFANSFKFQVLWQ